MLSKSLIALLFLAVSVKPDANPIEPNLIELKKDNFVSLGTWLLVGLRDYEAGGNNKKLQNCDLLEVYNDTEKERLKTSVNQDWSLFIKNDAKNSFTSQEVSNSFENVSFGDAKTIEYQELIASELSKPSENREIVTVDDEEINIDDI